MSWRGVGEGGGRGRTRGKWESQEKLRGKTREGGASMKEEGKEPAVHSDSGGGGQAAGRWARGDSPREPGRSHTHVIKMDWFSLSVGRTGRKSQEPHWMLSFGIPNPLSRPLPAA